MQTMTATIAALASSRWRGSGRHPWLCAHSIPASPRQARMLAAYRITLETRMVWLSDGRKFDSGSLTDSVSAFGAVAPSIMPSSRPTADTVTATRGLASLLHASLRMSTAISRPTGPAGSCSWLGRDVLGRPAGPAARGEAAGGGGPWSTRPDDPAGRPGP